MCYFVIFPTFIKYFKQFKLQDSFSLHYSENQRMTSQKYIPTRTSLLPINNLFYYSLLTNFRTFLNFLIIVVFCVKNYVPFMQYRAYIYIYIYIYH